MAELCFDYAHAVDAIHRTDQRGRDWLYSSYPKPGGKVKESTTGFLMHRGLSYPVKPLGRLANEIAGAPLTDNPVTDVFRVYFARLGFKIIANADKEAKDASARNRRLAAVWARPEQATFRRRVFELFGARCIVTGCDSLLALEAAHVCPVAAGGCDEGWNGVPLRADIHRLFDAGEISIKPGVWEVHVRASAGPDYAQYDGLTLGCINTLHPSAIQQLADALRTRGRRTN